jgi:hypothetical protein
MSMSIQVRQTHQLELSYAEELGWKTLVDICTRVLSAFGNFQES